MTWVSGFYAAQNANVSVAQIPWGLYTQVVHFAACPNSDGTVNLNYLTLPEIQAFQQRPSTTKALVCLKDASDQSAFASATSPANINKFVTNVVQFIVGNKYNGLEIDWEASVNVSQYNAFIAKLRVALPAGSIIAMSGGDWNSIPNVAAASQSLLDQCNVMCYDMDNAWSPTWFNCALQPGSSGQRTITTRMAAFSGVTASKLGVGVPFYARKWTGANQPLVSGNFGLPPTISYRQLVAAPEWQPANMVYDKTYHASYLSTTPPEFISYVSTQELTDIQAYITAQKYGGWSEFTLDSDDASFTMSKMIWSLAGGSVTPPVPTYAAPVTQPNGDLLFKRLT